jgi:hypothetical protein
VEKQIHIESDAFSGEGLADAATADYRNGLSRDFISKERQ